MQSTSEVRQVFVRDVAQFIADMEVFQVFESGQIGQALIRQSGSTLEEPQFFEVTQLGALREDAGILTARNS